MATQDMANVDAVCISVSVCIYGPFIYLHITAQSSPVILQLVRGHSFTTVHCRIRCPRMNDICCTVNTVCTEMYVSVSLCVCSKKKQNAPRPSEHPPVKGKKCQNV